MIPQRDVFAEMIEGFDALAQEREGKTTLRQHKVSSHHISTVTPEELIAFRTTLGVSRPVLADKLHINSRTMENWEQGRGKPSQLANVLLRLVMKYPDTLNKLEAI